MSFQALQDGRALVAAVRRAAAVHDATWQAMVPDQFTVSVAAEAAEEDAYLAMAVEKQKLRDHICATYGLSIADLAGLAMP